MADLFQNTVAYSFAFFLPQILLYGMGFSLTMTYVLIFPPYVLAAVVSTPTLDAQFE